MVGKSLFQRNSILFALVVVTAIVAASTSIIAAPPAHAQTETTVTITGGEGVVSLVVAPQRNISTGTGNSPTRPPREWPYTCNFYLGVTLEDVAVPVNPTPGNTYHLVCEPRDGFPNRPRIENFVYVYAPGVSVDPNQPGLLTSLDVRQAAQDAVNPTNLPPAFSPDDQQITGIETWLWPEGSRDSTSAWATAGGLTVTIESRYRQTEFTMTGANTGSVTCADAQEWAPGASNSDCTFTFTEEGAQSIAATTTWELFWWDNAASPAPQVLGTITETFVEVVDVVDLEAVITR